MVHPYRRRYVVIHITHPPDAGKGLLIKRIRDRTREMPEEEFRKLRSWVVYFQDGWSIIKFSGEATGTFLDMLNSLDGTLLKEGAFDFHIVGVSGTIRRAYMKYIPETVKARKHYHEDRDGIR